MGRWLVKSEPGDWSWDDQNAVDSEPWDGVRNHQAQNNMRKMQVDDPVLFYHSGRAPEIVGLCTVVRAPYPDTADETGKFCLVDLKAVRRVGPLPLQAIKAEPRLAELALVRQPRLSVMPIGDAEWSVLMAMCEAQD